MNENPQINGISSVALGFVLGAVVGAGIALLLAPRTGTETRQRLADAGGRLGDAARNKLNQARDVASGLKHDAASALDAGREAFAEGQKSRS